VARLEEASDLDCNSPQQITSGRLTRSELNRAVFPVWINARERL